MKCIGLYSIRKACYLSNTVSVKLENLTGGGHKAPQYVSRYYDAAWFMFTSLRLKLNMHLLNFNLTFVERPGKGIKE